MQKSLWPSPKATPWAKTHGRLFVVQMKGRNRSGEDIGWMDHAAYDVFEARRARRTANDLRRSYPGVPVRIVKKGRQ